MTRTVRHRMRRRLRRLARRAGGVTAPLSAAPEPIKIAAILSTSGPSAPLGVPEVERAEARRARGQRARRHRRPADPVRHRRRRREGRRRGAARDADDRAAVTSRSSAARAPTPAPPSRASPARANVLQVYTTPTESLWHTPRGVVKNVFQVNPRDQLEAIALLTFAKNRAASAKNDRDPARREPVRQRRRGDRDCRGEGARACRSSATRRIRGPRPISRRRS